MNPSSDFLVPKYRLKSQKFLVFQLPLFKSAEFAAFQDKIKQSIQDPDNKMLFKAGTEIKLNQILESQARQKCRGQQNFY